MTQNNDTLFYDFLQSLAEKIEGNEQNEAFRNRFGPEMEETDRKAWEDLLRTC